MRFRSAWMLPLVLVASTAHAQQPTPPVLPPHANSLFARTPFAAPVPPVDEAMIVTPPADAEYFIRRWGMGADTVHAFIRLLPEPNGPLPETPFVLPHVRPDSSAAPLFRLPDSLRADNLRRFFEQQQPGPRLERLPDSTAPRRFK